MTQTQIKVGDYVIIDEDNLSCKICGGKLSIDDSWSYVCPKGHSYHQNIQAKWIREEDKK